MFLPSELVSLQMMPAGRPRVSLVETYMNNLFARFVRDESGATAIEYGLIAALIAVVIIGAIQAVGTGLKTTFSSVSGFVK